LTNVVTAVSFLVKIREKKALLYVDMYRLWIEKQEGHALESNFDIPISRQDESIKPR